MKNRFLARNGKKVMSALTKISPVAGAYVLYFIRTKKIPNLKNPKDFNEKLTYLKLNRYATDKRVIQYADKFLVREYIKSKGYEEILNDLYGVYDSFDDIDFDRLPVSFALKCTHGCAYNIICHDKDSLDVETTRKKVNTWLKEKCGLATQELHYTKIEPRIIIEKNLCDKNGFMPVDYKLYCFNGKAEVILVCTERTTGLRLNYFDTKWEELMYGKEHYRSSRTIPKPRNLKMMLQIAECLSSEFPFVRVDLYENSKGVIFGELTFTPACSCAPYYSKAGLLELGERLNLQGLKK